MSRIDRLEGLLSAAFIVAFLLPAFAVGQDRDTQEVMSYALTEAGLAKCSQATKKLAALPGGAPSACNEWCQLTLDSAGSRGHTKVAAAKDTNNTKGGCV